MSTATATGNTVATTEETFTAKLGDFVAKYSGGVNSPNLPMGDWEFKRDDTGELFIESLESKRELADGSKATYDVAYVHPKGNPEGQVRRVYTSALVADSAKAILYTKEGNLKKSATFGVFSGSKDGVRFTTVSDKADVVSKGILAANAAYQKERAEKAGAEAVA